MTVDFTIWAPVCDLTSSAAPCMPPNCAESLMSKFNFDAILSSRYLNFRGLPLVMHYQEKSSEQNSCLSVW